MPRAAFTTLGCKVNQYETQRILESFAERGFEIVPFDAAADIYVINTCSVTSIAESKSAYMLRRARRANPTAKVVATGCAAQFSIIKGNPMPETDLVVPNPEKLKTLSHVAEAFPKLMPAKNHEVVPNATGRTRATLKVQDGCNFYCSYCSIPYTRPGMVSRPWHEVLAEAHRFADQGYKEIVLTGVLIGSYGPETGSEGPDFEDLVALLAQESGVPRIRISSIEMRQVTSKLVDLLKSGAVVPHLHIPLQSGDDQVLADMNRQYGRQEFIDCCQRLQHEVPGIAITTDVLVGFPTETGERFQTTAALFEVVGFLKAHVFSFSPRPGTPADALGDPVSQPEKDRRRAILTAIARESGDAKHRAAIGTVTEVLVEGKLRKDGLLEGLTRDYLSVRFAGDPRLARTIVPVRIAEYADGCLFGEQAFDGARKTLRQAIA